MGAAENKQLMREIFSELAQGNTRPFREAMAEDFSWTIIGSTSWSGTYSGRDAVLGQLMAPLFAQFDGRYENCATNIIAEGEQVVVECRGRARTRSGEPYDNTYCYVCRLAEGKLRELTEYCDTELISRALGAPAGA
jgi:uncharacterized protein